MTNNYNSITEVPAIQNGSNNNFGHGKLIQNVQPARIIEDNQALQETVPQITSSSINTSPNAPFYNMCPPIDYHYLMQENNYLKAELNKELAMKAKLFEKNSKVKKIYEDINLKGWMCEERNGRYVFIGQIEFESVVWIFVDDQKKPCAVSVHYITDGKKYSTTIPYDELGKRKILKYFIHFSKNPDCPEKYMNELLYKLLFSFNNSKVLCIPSQGGWQTSDDSKTLYYKGTSFDNSDYSLFISPALRKTRIKDTSRSPETVKDEYIKIMNYSNSSIILIMLRTLSYFLKIFESFGVSCNQAVIIEAHSDEEAAYAISLLKTFDRPSINSISLSDPKSVREALEDTNDGVVVIRDASYVDNANKNKTAIAVIQDDLSNATGNNIRKRHIITIISQYVDDNINSEYSFNVSMDNIPSDISSRALQELSEEFDSLLIRYMSENYGCVKEQVKSYLEEIGGKDEFVSLNSFNMYRMLAISIFITLTFFKIKYNKEKFLAFVKNYILSSSKLNFDYSQNIVDEFADVLNQKIEDGTLQVISYDSNTEFQTNSNNILYKSGIISFEPETIENCILPDMKKIKKINILIDLIKDSGYLYATNKNRHPIDLYDTDGKPLRIKAYSFHDTLLNKANRMRLANIDVVDFLIDSNEKQDDFLPLAHSYNNENIGKTVHMDDEENNHIYVTGQSGYGKTYCLSQLALRYTILGHRLVIFDSSNSFTKKALCKNLGSMIVDEYFSFIDLDTDGVPVDLFNISEYDTLPRRKNALFGILAASTAKLHTQQVSTLKSVISNVLKSSNADIISPDDIQLELEILVEEKNKYAPAILSRFESIIEDINSIGMSDKTWDYLFENNKPAIVITMSSGCCDNQYQLIDMLLASLYNYQCLHPDCQLDIIIDELQNQNLSENGPILKIMKEGRKNHIAFTGATQSFHVKGDKVGDVMTYAATQIFLKPTDESEDNVAKVLNYDKKKRKFFSQMERGDCIIRGNCYNKAKDMNCPVVIKGRI